MGTSEKDDGVASGSLALSGEFFGAGFTGYTPTISINGHVNFVGDDSYYNRPLGDTGTNRIAPMWQDFMIGDVSRIVESIGATYYAISWLNVENLEHEGHFGTFQAVFFNDTTTISGISFQSGDIVFSYGDFTNGFIGDEPTIGLENEGGGYSALTGTEPTKGVFYSSAGNVLPNGDGQFALFRPDGAGGYVTSIGSTIPEPSSAAVLLGGLALAGVALRRRR